MAMQIEAGGRAVACPPDCNTRHERAYESKLKNEHGGLLEQYEDAQSLCGIDKKKQWNSPAEGCSKTELR